MEYKSNNGIFCAISLRGRVAYSDEQIQCKINRVSDVPTSTEFILLELLDVISYFDMNAYFAYLSQRSETIF